MTFFALLQHGLLYGAVLAFLLNWVLLGSLYLNPEIGWRTYPPAVKEKFGPISARASRQRLVFGVVFLLLIVGTIVLALRQLEAQVPEPLTFAQAFLCTWLILIVFNVVDLLVVDWLIFIRLQPRFIFLPGTEGMAEYADFRFYLDGFIKGLVGGTIGSLLVAALVALF